MTKRKGINQPTFTPTELNIIGSLVGKDMGFCRLNLEATKYDVGDNAEFSRERLRRRVSIEENLMNKLEAMD